MGYDVMRFKSKVSDTFLCSICGLVLEEPLQTVCKKPGYIKPDSFCRNCIQEKIASNQPCVNCKSKGSVLNPKHLKPVAKQFEALLNNLEIKCAFASLGCNAVLKLDLLGSHEKACQFSPNLQVECNDCGAFYKKSEACDHWCVSHLKEVLEEKDQQIHVLKEEKDKQLQEITDLMKEKKELKKEVNRLKGEAKERDDRLNEVNDKLKQTEKERNVAHHQDDSLPQYLLEEAPDYWSQHSDEQLFNRPRKGSESSAGGVKGPQANGADNRPSSSNSATTFPIVKKPKISRLKLPPGEDAQEVEERAIDRLKQYLKAKSKEDEGLEVIEAFNEKNVHIYVKAAFNQGLDYNREDQALIGQLLRFLVVNRIINERSFFEGCYLMLEFADDLLLAFPNFWEDMGQMLAPFLIDLSREKRKQFFACALLPCIESGTGGQLMANIVKCATQLTSPIRVRNAWTSSGLLWTDFLGQDEDVSELIAGYGLEFLHVSSPNIS